MLTIEISLITGLMVGFEFIGKDSTDGEMSAFLLDLGIIRFGLYYFHDE
jgi:hypothetical protein